MTTRQEPRAMKTAAVPGEGDFLTAAQQRYEQRRQRLIDAGRSDTIPAWDDLHPAEQEDEVNQMRAAYAAGPRVAARLGLRTYSLSVTVPEIGQTVIHEGWPAIVTLTRSSADYYNRPHQAQTALPTLRDELHVHLHVLSALGPYPAYNVDHGKDGWLWPQEAADEREETEALLSARLERVGK